MPLELEQLSNDVTEHVAMHLNPIDLLELSFCSKEWDRLITSFKIHIRNFYVNVKNIDEDPASGVASAILGIQPVQRRFIHFFVYKRIQQEIDEMTSDPKTVLRIFDEKEFKCQIDQSNLKVYTTNPLETLYSIMDHMLRLFPGPIHHLNFGYVAPKVDEITFDILKMRQISGCNTLTISVGGTISEKLFKHILDFKNLSCLYQNCATLKPFKHYKEVNIRHFYLEFAEWVTRRSLLCLNCETLELGDPKLTLKDLNVFVKNWLNGNNTILRRAQINFTFGWQWEHDKKGGKDLFAGLEYRLWNPKHSSREQIYTDKERKIDCTDGRDIKRSDGALATIKCDSTHFYFVVWKYP